ncbi:MAG: type II toxin-antitoxin system Phd/YefM family antitoxin [Clostridiales Family XIII bacterium]|jgi:prevent-host-death family protein|nr:type II toxin-antitoxin system Phd/YefM family antitoxin [Clostridiales Family XIII bacterium]
MQTDSYSIYEAKTNLSKLIAKAKAGFPVVITNRGEPQVVVKAVPKKGSGKKPQRTGFFKEAFKGYTLPEDFNTMMEGEIAELFCGREADGSAS